MICIQRVEILRIPAPADIPLERLVRVWIAAGCNSHLVECLAGRSISVSNLAMVYKVARALQQLPLNATPVPESSEVTEESAHDSYFHVQRVEGDVISAFARMIFFARLTFLQDVYESKVTLTHSTLSLIDAALADLAASLFGARVNSSRVVDAWETTGQETVAIRRWIVGHHTFAVLTQGLIFSFRCMGKAMREGKNEEVRRWADLSISLLRGSGAAFEFTGDFPEADYNNIIRPSMMPPATPLCLSGLMSADHRFLAQTMRDMRPVFKALAEREPERHAKLRDSVASVYDSHIHVCERFVGNEPSIMTAARSEKSGPSLIQQFKSLRLKPFEASTHKASLAVATGPGANDSHAQRCPFPAHLKTEYAPAPTNYL